MSHNPQDHTPEQEQATLFDLEPEEATERVPSDVIDTSDRYVQTLATERTAAFFADTRASTIMLGQTLSMLIAHKNIQRGIVDLMTPAGLTMAAEFQKAGLPYDVLHLNPEGPEYTTEHDTDLDLDAQYLFTQATGVTQLSPQAITQLDANLVIIPAMAGAGEAHIDMLSEDKELLDFAPTTLPGVVLAQAEQFGRGLLLIDTPERGLVQLPDGLYQRRIMHIGQRVTSQEQQIVNEGADTASDV